MNLVIVESPTKARKLTKFLGKDYIVEASVGHIRDLPKSGLSVDTENNFEPTYEVSDGKKKVVSKLKQAASRADVIILATDPDREGEAIAWHVKHILETAKGKFKTNAKFVRATFNEVTKGAVIKAIENPTELSMDMVDAQQARRVVDRLVGYKLSPVLWKKVRRGLSAGRVQSVALRLIVEKEREIAAFRPDEYWEVDVALSEKELSGVSAFVKEDVDNSSNTENSKKSSFKVNVVEDLNSDVFVSRLVSVEGKKFEPKKEESVKPVVGVLDTASYKVSSIEKKARKRSSLAPFTTSTMQQKASTSFGYSGKQTMRLAQQLYEEGLITYHRTDSVHLSKTAVDMARDFITKEFGANYLPKTQNNFANKSKNAQEAHEAIRITDATIQGNDILQKSARFTPQNIKLYDLIWRRFMASQMEKAVYDQTSVKIGFENTGSDGPKSGMLRTSGSILKFDGWMKLFPNREDTLLPDINEGQKLNFVDKASAQKFTQPPSRFNDASLIKELEKRGIGRPSTYASIISVITDRGYVERTQKRFFASAVGMTVSDFLLEHFPKVMDYAFTAEMEENLDKISLGKKEWRKTVGDFYNPLEKKIESVTETAERTAIPVEKTGETCPDCIKRSEAGELPKAEIGEIVIRTGRFGKFKSCNKFPECKFTENIVEVVEDVICPLCQKGDVTIKNTRWGKPFFGCGTYPTCNWASWKKPEKGEIMTKEEWAVLQAAREERKKKWAERKKKSAEAKEAKEAKGGKKVTKKATKKKKVVKKTVKPKAKKKTVKKVVKKAPAKK